MSLILIALVALWATALVVVGIVGSGSSINVDHAFTSGEQIIRTQASDGREAKEHRAA